MARLLHVDAHTSCSRRVASIYLRPGDVHERHADKRGSYANNCIFHQTIAILYQPSYVWCFRHYCVYYKTTMVIMDSPSTKHRLPPCADGHCHVVFSETLSENTCHNNISSSCHSRLIPREHQCKLYTNFQS